MGYFLIFVLFIIISEIDNVIKSESDKKGLTIAIYICITIFTLLAGIYCYFNEHTNSLGYYIIKLLGIEY